MAAFSLGPCIYCFDDRLPVLGDVALRTNGKLLTKAPKSGCSCATVYGQQGKMGVEQEAETKNKKKTQKCFSAAKKEGTRWAGRLVQLSMMQCCCNSRVGKSIGRSQ